MSKDNKKKEQKKKSYIVGPFKEAMDNVDAFGTNMYYSYYYHNAIENMIKIQDEYQEALLESEEAALEKIKSLDFYKEVLDMVTDLKLKTEEEDHQ
tara:strand:- start:158 stop:445 length:288 start_codon:yes stop_codon:yes gene_type:complete